MHPVRRTFRVVTEDVPERAQKWPLGRAKGEKRRKNGQLRGENGPIQSKNGAKDRFN